jgi:Ni/Co efflux regulator RcnB
MKKTVLALTTVLILAGAMASTASAQQVYYDVTYADDTDRDGIPNHYDRYDNRYDRYGNMIIRDRYAAPYGYRYSRWDVGSRLPVGYYGSAYYIDYRLYGLPPPPYGYQWNRVGNDAYLVSTRDGLIAEVAFNLFR